MASMSYGRVCFRVMFPDEMTNDEAIADSKAMATELNELVQRHHGRLIPIDEFNRAYGYAQEHDGSAKLMADDQLIEGLHKDKAED